MNTLHVGDVVQLNSGGPNMTVVEIDIESGSVRCGWTDYQTFEPQGRKSQVQWATFPFGALKLVEALAEAKTA